MTIHEFLLPFSEHIQNASSILISSHRAPDDDSISSVLSLKYWIEKKYPQKKVTIIYEGDVNSRWSDFLGFDEIQEVSDFGSLDLQQFDVFIGLDANDWHRFSQNGNKIESAACTKIAIDHHPAVVTGYDLRFVDTNAASTAEILFQMLYTDVDKTLAKLLLLGILGDTGNLRFIGPSQVYVYDIVKKLVSDSGVSIQTFKSSYDYFSEEAVDVTQLLLKNRQIYTINDWPTFSVSYLERGSSPFPTLETKEGITLYTQTFSRIQKGVNWSIVLYPSSEGVKISTRSQPGCVNVRSVMESMKLGGGHDFAAGGLWRGADVAVESRLHELLEWIKDHNPIID